MRSGKRKASRPWLVMFDEVMPARWMWSLCSSAGIVIAESTGSYPTQSAVRRAFRLARRALATERIVMNG